MDNADSKILLGMNKEKKSETTVDQKTSKRPKTKTTNIKDPQNVQKQKQLTSKEEYPINQEINQADTRLRSNMWWQHPRRKNTCPLCRINCH